VNNEEFVLSSVEKHKTHELINSKFWPWIELNFDKPGRIITMPSRSGRQENLILEYIQQLEKKYGRKSNLELYTYDDIYEAEETGINLPHPHRLWRHERCPDIFKRVMRRWYREGVVAAWFDLTGGLLNRRLLDIQACIAKIFDHGSLMFITLAVDNARGLTKDHYARLVYDQCEELQGRVDATDSMLTRTIEQLGNKYIVPCNAPYVYKHGRATFGVFGYIIGKL
jgi:hypothetical protein